MKFNPINGDVVMKGSSVLSSFESIDGYSESKLLDLLRKDANLAAELLSYKGIILYSGSAPRGGYIAPDGTIKGENIYGKFLMKVRDIYRNELALQAPAEENPILPNQIIVNYALEDLDYPDRVAVERARNTNLIFTCKEPVSVDSDGKTYTTSDGIDFHTFTCPFGTSYDSKVRVESQAEASFLYEKAVRGELDWEHLFSNLKSRGLLPKRTDSENKALLQNLKAQFDWVREQICTNKDLKNYKIVASNLLISDASFGRSIFDGKYAPSPAHILARYINNPLALFSSSSCVAEAIGNTNKDEQIRFSAVGPRAKQLTVIIDGSDTIGGREPNTRRTKRRQKVYQRDSNGNLLYVDGRPVVSHYKDVYDTMFKSDIDRENDYKAFSNRLEQALANIRPGVSIRFVAGKGAGVPNLIERYTIEHGGTVYNWDFESKAPQVEKKGSEESSRFSLVRFDNFTYVLPVLTGAQASCGDEEINFQTKDLKASCMLEFTDSTDRRLNEFILRGSIASMTGFPVIHIQNNLSEEEQLATLNATANLIREQLFSEQSYTDSLFENVQNKWDLKQCNVLSLKADQSEDLIPEIAVQYPAPVFVNSIPYHSVYSIYIAMLMRDAGVTDYQMFRNLSSSENSMTAMTIMLKNITDKYNLDDSVHERCMRNALHTLTISNSALSSRLLALDDKDIAVIYSAGNNSSLFDNLKIPLLNKLFIDNEGNGENRFGVVYKAEREAILRSIEAERQKEEADAKHLAEENSRLQRKANTHRAEGEKVPGGLPSDRDKMDDSVWFFGANRPLDLILPDDGVSFTQWIVSNSQKDILNREMASRPVLVDDDGDRFENKLVFLFPSDLMATTGARNVKTNADARDLTGLQRVNPTTGKAFTCAFGIPVKNNPMFYEQNNNAGRRSSFRMDRDASDFFNSIVAADALARSTAFQQDMMLCYAVRERTLPGGEENDDLSRVFNEKIYDFPRTEKDVIDYRTGRIVTEAGTIIPKEVKQTYYSFSTKSYYERTQIKNVKEWVPNPHHAPRLKNMLRRYQNILKEGANYPLNCICMPKSDYTNVSQEEFLADFNMTLSIANAAALANGVKMKFPLDAEGRLDLGIDVPDEYKIMAERKLDSFLNIVSKESLDKKLPLIKRIPISASVRKDMPLIGDGSDLYLRPNDFLPAFGSYDFSYIESGQVAPMHEMAFCDDEGNLYRVTDTRLTRNIPISDVKRYLRYDKNDECRFIVKSTNPEKIRDFIRCLKAYIELSKQINIETRLYSEADMIAEKEKRAAEIQSSNMSKAKKQKSLDALDDMYTLDGYFRILSSNTREVSRDEFTLSTRDEKPEIGEDSALDNTYAGWEDAKDGFAGYVQYRYKRPDGTMSTWQQITDRELALDIALSKIDRKYRMDTREVLSDKILEAKVRSLAFYDNLSLLLAKKNKPMTQKR